MKSDTTLDARRAEGIVNALVDEDSCTCKCGQEIDLDDADTTMRVVEELEKHRRVCPDANQK